MLGRNVYFAGHHEKVFTIYLYNIGWPSSDESRVGINFKLHPEVCDFEDTLEPKNLFNHPSKKLKFLTK